MKKEYMAPGMDVITFNSREAITWDEPSGDNTTVPGLSSTVEDW